MCRKQFAGYAQATVGLQEATDARPRQANAKQKLHGYVLTKAKACAATARLSLLIVVTVLATGAIPPKYGEARVEVFFNGERLQGSCTNTPLPPKLEDATKRTPILPSWVTTIKTIRDGCGAQCT